MERYRNTETSEKNGFIFPDHTFFLVHGGGKPQVIDGRMKLSPYSPPLSPDCDTVYASGVRARAYALDTLYQQNPDNQWRIFTLGHAAGDDRRISSALALHHELARYGISSLAVATPTDTLTEIIEGNLIAAGAVKSGVEIECVAHLSNKYHIPRIQLMDSLLSDPNGYENLKTMIHNSLEDHTDYQYRYEDFMDTVVRPAVAAVLSGNVKKAAVSAEDVLRGRSQHWGTVIDSLESWQLEDGQNPWTNRLRIEQEGIRGLLDGSYRFNADSLIEYLHAYNCC